ncbi:28440_t:CDS:2, partial [Gigaspora margarita]
DENEESVRQEIDDEDEVPDPPVIAAKAFNTIQTIIHYEEQEISESNLSLKELGFLRNLLKEYKRIYEKSKKQKKITSFFNFQGSYSYDSHPQDTYPQDLYFQDLYSQDSYPQDLYFQGSYSQDSYPQDLYSQDSYSQNLYFQELDLQESDSQESDFQESDFQESDSQELYPQDLYSQDLYFFDSQNSENPIICDHLQHNEHAYIEYDKLQIKSN